MTKEELINLLHEKGLDDAAVKALLEEVLQALNPQAVQEEDVAAKEEAEKKEAGRLLGVSL